VAGETILAVDDNETNLKLVRVFLTSEGYDVITALDAAEALAVLAKTRPQLILMDLQMPGMDGLTLTRQLKQDPAILYNAAQAHRLAGDTGLDPPIGTKLSEYRRFPTSCLVSSDDCRQSKLLPRPFGRMPACMLALTPHTSIGELPAAMTWPIERVKLLPDMTDIEELIVEF